RWPLPLGPPWVISGSGRGRWRTPARRWRSSSTRICSPATADRAGTTKASSGSTMRSGKRAIRMRGSIGAPTRSGTRTCSTPAVALSFAQIRADLAAIKVASGYKPDIAIVSPNVWNKLAALFDPQKFYVVQTNVAPTASGLVTLDGGVNALKFDGCTFVEDVW